MYNREKILYFRLLVYKTYLEVLKKNFQGWGGVEKTKSPNFRGLRFLLL